LGVWRKRMNRGRRRRRSGRRRKNRKRRRRLRRRVNERVEDGADVDSEPRPRGERGHDRVDDGDRPGDASAERDRAIGGGR
jgi:hypothetical protein